MGLNSTTKSSAAEWVGADRLAELLADGLDPDGNDSGGDRWAVRAAVEGDARAIRLLALAGADLDAGDAFGFSPLLHAVDGRHVDAVRALLESGAKPDRGGEPFKRIPLALAAETAQSEALEALLSFGADPDRLDMNGRAPLAVAVENFDARSVKALIAAGADPNGRWGSVSTGHVGQAIMALGFGSPNVDEGLETIRALLEGGADPNRAFGTAQIRPLHACCEREGLRPLIKAFLAAGADMDLRDGSGATAREVASRRGALDLLDGALAELAEVDIYGASGEPKKSPRARL